MDDSLGTIEEELEQLELSSTGERSGQSLALRFDSKLPEFNFEISQFGQSTLSTLK